MEAEDLRPISFVPFDESTVDLVVSMHNEAYPPDMVIWDKEMLMSDVFLKREIGRFSFVLHGSAWLGHCLSFVGVSEINPASNEKMLYIADMVVRPPMQGKGYGRVMSEEALKRAREAGINHIELHARESTTYSAIQASRNTQRILDEFGYTKVEHHRERFKKWRKAEYGRLISLEKIENADCPI